MILVYAKLLVIIIIAGRLLLRFNIVTPVPRLARENRGL